MDKINTKSKQLTKTQRENEIKIAKKVATALGKQNIKLKRLQMPKDWLRL